ncbi:SDR family NAD(P)-dependent oxidoreductase [Haloimpatiens sp. FM7330]|uniref:SDR family NAD(P)-dependent oxidoreductase n=1 Tax=Haloimpatiens sp. FM7330 TaxID=3298610 RepID=UPI003633A606
MSKLFENQIAIVTGGNSGIGEGVSMDLAKNGAKVMIVGRNEAKNEKVKKAIENENGYAECYKVDVSKREEVEKAVNTIYEKHKKIDILISNAGNSTQPKFCTDMTYEEWDVLIKTHLYGTFNFVKACGEKMKHNKYGRIVLTSSLAGIMGFTGSINYSSAKTGLVGMTYTLCKELGPYGITVNAVQPGIIRTNMTSAALSQMEEPFKKATPVQKIGEPKDVANAVRFFCMPESSFITGVVMRVDGGYILNSQMDQLMFQMCSSQEK